MAQDVVPGDRAPCRRSGRDSVVRIFTVVDLPAPFGPSSPKIVPGATRQAHAVEGADVARVDLDEVAGHDGRPAAGYHCY